jgi:hypothetical protein
MQREAGMGTKFMVRNQLGTPAALQVLTCEMLLRAAVEVPEPWRQCRFWMREMRLFWRAGS